MTSRWTAALIFAIRMASAADMSEDRIRTAMQSSLERQKLSVRHQVENARELPGAVFFTVAWPAPPTPVALPLDCPSMEPARLAGLVEEHAKRESVSAELVRAVIEQESGGKPCAVSSRGALGLMQLMPDTAAELAVQDAFDPEQNIAGGVKYLKKLLEKFGGNLELVLGAYNAGPNRVERSGAVPDITETQNYVNSIMQRLKSSSP